MKLHAQERRAFSQKKGINLCTKVLCPLGALVSFGPFQNFEGRKS